MGFAYGTDPGLAGRGRRSVAVVGGGFGGVCAAVMLDENGNNPNQWPWLWTTHRRRTARLQPGAYELGSPIVGGV